MVYCVKIKLKNSYETTSSTKGRKLIKEVILALTSSIVLGLGIFFLLLWCGVYV
jgi:hypothetical protein